jgi:hypothetical protein
MYYYYLVERGTFKGGGGGEGNVRYGASKESETPYFVEGCVARTPVAVVG